MLRILGAVAVGTKPDKKAKNTHRRTNTQESELATLLNEEETERYDKFREIIARRMYSEVLSKQVSQEHWQRLARLTPLAAATNRVETFAAAAEVMDWGPSTQETYWATILSILKIAEVQAEAKDKAFMKILKEQSANRPTWDAEDDEELLDDDRIATLKQLAEVAVSRSTNTPAIPIYVALALGHRMSDILGLERDNIRIIKDNLSPDGRLAVTFVKHKTAKTTGPYSLAVPTNTLLAQCITLACQTRGPTGLLWETDLAQIHATAPFHFNVRALRRTGLVRLATQLPLEMLLTFSRHTNVRMLEIYLFRGAMNYPVARAQLQALSYENTLMPQIQAIPSL